MRIVLTGGGSGGHVVPNLAVIAGLRKDKDVKIEYIGSKNGVEKKMIQKISIPYHAISTGKLRRYFSWENFKDLLRVPVGVWEARRELKRFKPDVVFSKGGYVSLPVAVAGYLLRIPVILHESDVMPGLANRISARFANKICVSFEETKKYFNKKCLKKVVVTGNPVRVEILDGDREQGYKFTGFDRHRPVILVMGGSMGARQVNELIRGSLGELLKRYQVVHIVGKGELDIGIHKKGYKQFEYLDEELRDVYAICELIVSRAGANSLAEIAMLKKKAVIIPLGLAASRGDQIENARVMANQTGWSVLEGKIGRDDFVRAIEMSFRNELKHSKIKNGTKEIVELILKIGS